MGTWALEIADSAKGLDRVAILPAVDSQNDTSWTNWEYRGLYERIVWGNLQGHAVMVWMVIDERRNSATELSDWLDGS